MSKLVWDEQGKKTYETGLDHGVLYPIDDHNTYSKGVAWNGLTGFTESPSGADSTAIYADNIKYLSLTAAEDFGGTIEAVTYPPEWEECDGSVEVVPGVVVTQQNRKVFGFCYRTILGNDAAGNDYGYKLHLIYGAKASPSERAYTSINDSPEAITFSWEITTTPVEVDSTHKPTARLIIDSTKVDGIKLKKLEDILYGAEATEARLPMPAEVISLLTAG